MAEEEKGFVVKDKRSLDDDGALKSEQTVKPEKEEADKTKEAPEQKEDSFPLPEVNFSSLILSLSSSVLFHFGEIPDPQTGEKKKELTMAKPGIDTIAMLKEKTKGNLSKEESMFVENVLTDLRWRYVKAR
jgi:hypothetical protein